MYHIFFIHFLVEGYLGCFQVLAITNNASMNIVKHISLWYGWASIEYIPKSVIARLFPNFLRNNHTDFQSSYTSLHSHQQRRSVLLTLYPFQHKLLLVFFILDILIKARWYLRVVLICISLTAKDVEHFLKCLLTFWDSSVENSLFRPVPHF